MNQALTPSLPQGADLVRLKEKASLILEEQCSRMKSVQARRADVQRKLEELTRIDTQLQADEDAIRAAIHIMRSTIRRFEDME